MSGERDRDGEPASSGEPDGWTEGDIDAAFAEIVARYGGTAPDIGPWPAAEDLDEPAPDAERRPREGRSTSAGPSSGGTSSAGPTSGGTPPGGTPPGGTTSGGTPLGGTPPERSGRPGPSARGTPPAPTDLPATARPSRTQDADGDRDTGEAPSDGSADQTGARPRQRHREPDAPDAPDATAAEPGRLPTGDDPPRHLPDEVQADDDPFVPPEPLPIAPGDFVTSLAWVCVLGGPLVLLVAALAWRSIPGELILAAVMAFIGGFVTLVARLPGERPDDPDDGAVV